MAKQFKRLLKAMNLEQHVDTSEPADRPVEICPEKMKANEVVEELKPINMEEILKYSKRGCYECNGRDRDCEFYPK